MRTLALLLFLACWASPTFAQVADEPPKGIVAFIGKKVSLRETPGKCPSEAETLSNGDTVACLQFDATFEAVYVVEHVLAGSLPDSTLTFFVADHYGSPDFAEADHALLFVANDEEGWYLIRYHGFAVFPSVEWWATCGNVGGRDGWRKAVRPLTYTAAPAECTQGIPARDLYELVRAEEGIALPPL